MSRNHRLFVGTALLVLLIGTSLGLRAQEAPDQSVTTDHQVEGILASVEPDFQQFTVRELDGNEMRFTYDAMTEVTGSELGVAGLAGTNTRIIVHYTVTADESNKATKIEVQT